MWLCVTEFLSPGEVSKVTSVSFGCVKELLDGWGWGLCLKGESCYRIIEVVRWLLSCRLAFHLKMLSPPPSSAHLAEFSPLLLGLASSQISLVYKI